MRTGGAGDGAPRFASGPGVLSPEGRCSRRFLPLWEWLQRGFAELPLLAALAAGAELVTTTMRVLGVREAWPSRTQ